MAEHLVLQTPPLLDPSWLKHEQDAGLLLPQPVFASPRDRQLAYSKACKDRNVAMLSGRDAHLKEGLSINDINILSHDGQPIDIRIYQPMVSSGDDPKLPEPSKLLSAASAPSKLVLYLHGGGLKVGDLDSEDLSCRRIAASTLATVYSVDYRLMPDVSADTCLHDALDAFSAISAAFKDVSPQPKVVLVGSSSGGQLAAQVAAEVKETMTTDRKNSTSTYLPIHGMLLRCPVTANALDEGQFIPLRFRELHTSNSEPFFNSLGDSLAYTVENVSSSMPLNANSFEGLPTTFVQVCSNDIYYSDGVCYVKALQDAGVKTKLDVVEGFPHTFWLKAPHLERALKAEEDMIEGLRWLFES